MSERPNGITYSEFRRRCEDKKTLTENGSLYVGTGRKNNGVYETEELKPPTREEGRKYLASDALNGTRWVDLYKTMSMKEYKELKPEDKAAGIIYLVYPD